MSLESMTHKNNDGKDTKLLDLYLKKLGKFEKDEVLKLNIKKIYYYFKDNDIDLGLEYNDNNMKILFDENYRYKTKTKNHIKYRYEILCHLGKGSYSDVVKCIDHKKFTKCAIKISKNHESYISSVYSEINILKICKNNKYFVNFINDFKFRNHYCIVMDLYGNNLLSYNFKKKRLSEKIKLLKDVLYGLDFLKNNQIVHGDLKPENIILTLDEKSAVITDFGLSTIYYKNKINYFMDIQTIWYRSPEIFFKIPYNEAIDMWSYGILLYELLLNNHFITTKKGDDYLIHIVHVLGLPSEKYILSDYRIITHFSHINNTWELNRGVDSYNIILLPGKKNILNIDYVLENCNLDEFIISLILQYVKKCLLFQSEERITPKKSIEFINYILSEINILNI